MFGLYKVHSTLDWQPREVTMLYYNITPTATINRLPIDSIPITPIYRKRKLILTIPRMFPARLEAQPRRWSDYIQTPEAWDKYTTPSILHMDIDELLNRIHIGEKLHICSDGGADTKAGSFALVIASDKRILLNIFGKVNGDKLGSFRPEATGMFAPLHYLHKLKKFFDIHHELVVKQVIDSKSLIL